ncbi:hypothetical protein BH10PSE14_BH10PSE14_10910 [soil metagenome]
MVLFGVVILSLAGTANIVVQSSRGALGTLLSDRVHPLHDLKIVGDKFGVDIVDASHKARNGGMTMAQAAGSVAAAQAAIRTHWQAYIGTRIEGKEADLAREATARMSVASAAADKVHAILVRGDRAALDHFVVQEMYPAIDPETAAIGNLVDIQIEIANDVTSSALSTAGIVQTGSILLTLIAAGIWLLAFMVIRSSVIRPIDRMADVMSALATGNDVVVPFVERNDEMGRMARSCEHFRAGAAQRALLDVQAAATQALVTTALKAGVAALAGGDLRKTIETPFPADYEEVRTNFNEAVSALRALIQAVVRSAGDIRTGSGEIATASEDLAKRTESSAASLEETNAALVQIDTRLKSAAGSSVATVARADQAITTVRTGRDMVDGAVQAMGRVSGSAKGIDSVIEGLDKIAFQTRVLAMNAAVEAGRAGEAGRGFAVVADLVSALAMRAEEEAKRARDQLSVTQAEITVAVEAVEKVDGALAAIAEDVDQVHQLLAGMADDNNAQSLAVSEIAVALGAMDRATQQNAAMVEETSAAARNLSSETVMLVEQTATFQFEHDAGASRPLRVRAPGTVGAHSPARTVDKSAWEQVES